jgi:hypothetical protein
VLGEVVIMEHWLKLLDEIPEPDDYDGHNPMLQCILNLTKHDLTQRDAQVASSFIRWLGTNNGRGFLRQAEQMVETLQDRWKGYVAAWAIENTRSFQVNLGMKTVEAVLSVSKAGFFTVGEPKARPDISTQDIDVIENMIQWLGSSRGKLFLDVCEVDLNQRLKEQSLQRRRNLNGRACDDQPAVAGR